MAGRWMRSSVARWLRGLAVSVAAVAAVSGLIALLDSRVPALSLLVLYILAVLAVAVGWGTALAVVAAILSAVCFAYLFLPPVGSIQVADWRELVALGVFLVTAVVVGELAARSRRQAQRSARLSEEQSALRRVATLVAQAGPPSVIASTLLVMSISPFTRRATQDCFTSVKVGSGSRSQSSREVNVQK